MTLLLWMHSSYSPHIHTGGLAMTFLGYAIVAFAVILTAYALVRTVRWAMRPREDNPDQIQRTALQDERPSHPWPPRP